jgi:IS5 family transposase
MKNQVTFGIFKDELAEIKTQKKKFLDTIEKLLPWKEWEGLVYPHYYKGLREQKPYPLHLMLRIYVLQNFYDLSDMKASDEVADSHAFSDFCGINSANEIPDGDTIGRFRNILVKNKIQEKFFKQVAELLIKEKLILKKERLLIRQFLKLRVQRKIQNTNVMQMLIIPKRATFGILDIRRISELIPRQGLRILL